MASREFKDIAEVALAHGRFNLTCRSCCKRSIIMPVALSRIVPLDVTLPQLGKRLRCSTCGAREPAMEVVIY
jgi:hypothetical protein